MKIYKIGTRLRVKTCFSNPGLVGHTGVVVESNNNDVTLSFKRLPKQVSSWSHSYKNMYCWALFSSDSVERVRVKEPSVADDLRLKPQSKTILLHLKRKGAHITPMKALIVYGVSRLAACIHDIRKAGYVVNTEMMEDEECHKYAEYSLIPSN